MTSTDGATPERPSEAEAIRAFVVGRRRAGFDPGPAIASVTTELLRAGWLVETAVVLRKRDVRRTTRDHVKDGVNVVVAVGGDGLVRQVASRVARTAACLAIIPTGTGNLLATNLGIPRGLQAASEVVVRGRIRSIDVGEARIGKKRFPFSVACGIGYDAHVMGATDSAQKRRWGKLAYIASAIREAPGIRNAPHTLTLDGSEIRTDAAQVFVANFGQTIRGIQPRRRVRPDDGLLDVFVVRAAGPLPAVLAGWEALTQTTMGESPGGGAFRARARHVEIVTSPRRLVEADGSVIGRTPVSVSVEPHALRVIVPNDGSRASPKGG